ncbi:minichromosome maintenance protein MCM [Candidatus Methanoplasma termitum]|uniref:MCM protein n=1 Tax=Candidatus Methanoplasma termitum TaxID=1577791 RepID=A0A0A7LIF5_9ARCH|nr:minichromosome maintenance protein MCM [Candidatus Methanoplasma termitum]AIZ57291.1 minichromosome maintenance protein MCM [Candidatus Methanoplasma termitum]MCL2334070.1 minichromosome maintenance protein MCM [Candidatus Methanoplasma sp.]
MTVNFQDSEIVAGWEDILSKDKYRIMFADIAASYPDKKSIYVDYEDIDAYNPDLAMFFLDNPSKCLHKGAEVVRSSLPPTWDMKDTVNLRITCLPRDAKVEVRHLRAKHLGKLVAVEGLARKVTTVKPRMTQALFRCSRCGAEIWEKQRGVLMKEPLMCSNPDGSCNKQATHFELDSKASVYIDTQKIEIQESPEGLRGGAQPERISGFLEDDIAGIVTAGNRITINGIVRSAEKPDRDKTTIFETFMDVISIEFEEHEYDEIQITEEDELQILEMSQDPKLFDNIVASISPTIFGMTEVKGAIALQLFGGCNKEMDDGTVIRGDMHVLLVGDPGVAKSQILRYMSTLAPRGIYASGKSASAAGLTAAAVKDEFGDGRWTLEAGALVLADKGLACIDELDKMTPQDRSSLHEAMESQRISVAKAGITATLQCRCSMLAAANPKFGRFETTGTSITSQIDLPPALMSRFDLIFVLTDKPNAKTDMKLTSHILNVHRRGEARHVKDDAPMVVGIDLKKIKENTQAIKPVYDQDMLRKYVAYSKRIVPVMTDEAMSIIEKTYLEIRAQGAGENDSVPITARQLEAFVRLSEASARMRLSYMVEGADAQRAVDLVQYYLDKILAPNGGQWDIDNLSADYTKKDRNELNIILDVIREYGSIDGLSEEEIISHSLNEGLSEDKAKRRLRMMKEDGTLFSPRNDGRYKGA